MSTSKQKPKSSLPEYYMNDLGPSRTPREQQAIKATANTYKTKMFVIAVSAFILLMIYSRSLDNFTAETDLETQELRTVSSSKLLGVTREVGALPEVDHIHLERVEAELQANLQERKLPAAVGASSDQVKAKMAARQRVVQRQLQNLNQAVGDLGPNSDPNQPTTIEQDLQQHLQKVADDI